MTATEAPNAGDSQITGEINVLEQGFILLKQVHGINVFVSPDTGRFYAKFAQTADVKWYERPSLAALETLITAAVYPYSGHVEVLFRPKNLVDDRTISDLEDGFLSDEEAKQKRSYRNYRFLPKRDGRVLTGVVRREFRYGQTRVHFKTESEGVQVMEEGYVHPDESLDNQYFALATLYVENQRDWRRKFQAIIDRYKPFSINEIIETLRAQGAKVPRN